MSPRFPLRQQMMEFQNGGWLSQNISHRNKLVLVVHDEFVSVMLNIECRG